MAKHNTRNPSYAIHQGTLNMTTKEHLAFKALLVLPPLLLLPFLPLSLLLCMPAGTSTALSVMVGTCMPLSFP